MLDGMYAYRMIDYELTTRGGFDRDGNDDDPEKKKWKPKTRNLVQEGVYSTDPQIPGPTLVFAEGDIVTVTLKNNACDDNFSIGGVGRFENSQVGIHMHGVHYEISDDATYDRVNMSGTSTATCGSTVEYKWDVALGTEGTSIGIHIEYVIMSVLYNVKCPNQCSSDHHPAVLYLDSFAYTIGATRPASIY